MKCQNRKILLFIGIRFLLVELGLSDATAVKPTFVTDKVGAYTVSLVVSDGVVNSPLDTVTINAVNTAPADNAGSDQTAGVGDTVTLNGSGSSVMPTVIR